MFDFFVAYKEKKMKKLFILLFITLGSIIFAFNSVANNCEANIQYSPEYLTKASNSYYVQYQPGSTETNQETNTLPLETVNDTTSDNESKGLSNFISDHLVGVVITVLIIWIGVIFLSKKTTCVIFYGWLDLIVLIVAGCIFTYLNFFAPYTITDLNPLVIVIFVIALIVTAVFSVIANLKSGSSFKILFIIISIMLKALLLVLTPLLIFALVSAGGSGKKDARYADGTEGNTKTKMVLLVLSIVALLVIPLVKTKEQIEGIEEISEEENQEIEE